MRWITFDCFGTLVDWHSGFSTILRPLVGNRTPEVVSAYHRFERLLEAEQPHRMYRDVLVTALLRAAAEVGVTLSEAQARTLPDSWATLPVFDDTEPMLAGLRAMGCSLAVLTNCDEALFEETHRAFRHRFDLVVTAERVRDYKPSPTHFRFFSQSSGVRDADWVHVACSWYHDIVPTGELGIRQVWLDREDTRQDGKTPSAHVRSATEVCGAVAALFGDGSRHAVDSY